MAKPCRSMSQLLETLAQCVMLLVLLPVAVSSSSLDAAKAVQGQVNSLANKLSSLQGNSKLSTIQKGTMDLCNDYMSQSKNRAQMAVQTLQSNTPDRAGAAIWISAAHTLAATCLDELMDATDMSSGMTGGSTMGTPKAAAVAGGSSLANGLPLPSLSPLSSAADSAIGDVTGGSGLSGGNGNRVLREELPRNRRLLQQQSCGNSPAPIPFPTFIVDNTGNGCFSTVQAAVNALPNTSAPVSILIKPGVYQENVVIARNSVTLFALQQNTVEITASISSGLSNVTTSKTATVTVKGDSFTAVNITFTNSAPTAGNQAVALLVNSDKAAFFGCTMQSLQDTLYANTGRQYYRNCTIIGNIDFIFGNAAAVFYNCSMRVRQNMKGNQCTVTAQSRSIPNDTTGYVFASSSVILANASESCMTYLGRPWKIYSRTVFSSSFLDSLIAPAGWIPWNLQYIVDEKPYYAEYHNWGPGSNMSARPKWVQPPLTASQFSIFTSNNFINGNQWVMNSGVQYT